MTGARATADGRHGSRPWLIAGVACALVATSALMLAEEVRWLRLGIIAALWAALLGAFLATKYRRQAEHAWDTVADAQHIYELELEREITARREYELELEAATRRRVEQETHSELQQLRAELMELRDSLRQLMGGEVFYERVALTEQSTRRRAMHGDQTGIAPGEHGGPSRAIAGGTAYEEVADQRTQVISRVIASGVPKAQRERPMYVDEPPHEPFQQRGYQSAERDVYQPEQRQLEPAPPEPQHDPYQDVGQPEQPPERFLSQPVQLERPAEHAAEREEARFDDMAGPGQQGASDFSLADYTSSKGHGAGDAARDFALPAFSEFEPGSFGANGNGSAADLPVNGNGHAGGFTGSGAPDANGANGSHRRQPGQPPRRQHNDRSDTGDLSAVLGGDWSGQRQQPQQEHSWFTPNAEVTPQDDGQAGAHRQPESAGNNSLPAGAREIQRQGRPGGRRRKPDPDDAAPETPDSPMIGASGQDYAFSGVNGNHSRYQPEQHEDTGSHASGKSVHELLAAHGRDTSSRRHRYRD